MEGTCRVKRICSVEGCDRPRERYSFCSGHYERIHTYGYVGTGARIKIKPRERDRLKAMGKNICGRCRKTLPLRDFPKSGNSNRCTQCRNLNMRCRGHPGLTPEILIDLFERQRGRCRICKKKLVLFRTGQGQGGTKDTAVIDHCHKTGDFRGILCLPCNSGIGLLGDSSKRLHSAAHYLESFEIRHPMKRIHKTKIRRRIDKHRIDVAS